MQSLSRQGEINLLVENYGHVIVDESHHVGAASFDAILKRVKAKYVLGLTATPIRRDGQDLPQEAGIQEVFRQLANDPARTARLRRKSRARSGKAEKFRC